MPLMEIGTIVLVLLVIVILGNLWFHFVEAILGRIGGLSPGKRSRRRGIPFHQSRRTGRIADIHKSPINKTPPDLHQYNGQVRGCLCSVRIPEYDLPS